MDLSKPKAVKEADEESATSQVVENAQMPQVSRKSQTLQGSGNPPSAKGSGNPPSAKGSGNPPSAKGSGNPPAAKGSGNPSKLTPKGSGKRPKGGRIPPSFTFGNMTVVPRFGGISPEAYAKSTPSTGPVYVLPCNSRVPTVQEVGRTGGVLTEADICRLVGLHSLQIDAAREPRVPPILYPPQPPETTSAEQSDRKSRGKNRRDYRARRQPDGMPWRSTSSGDGKGSPGEDDPLAGASPVRKSPHPAGESDFVEAGEGTRDWEDQLRVPSIGLPELRVPPIGSPQQPEPRRLSADNREQCIESMGLRLRVLSVEEGLESSPDEAGREESASSTQEKRSGSKTKRNKKGKGKRKK